MPLLSRLFGSLKCVVFTPEDLFIAKGSPDNRRSFVDLSSSQLKKSFVYALNKYENLLSQRNALIKKINFTGSGSADDLPVRGTFSLPKQVRIFLLYVILIVII